MYITTTYIGTLNGISGIWCGFKPEGAKIKTEQLVLHAETEYILKNKQTEETTYSVLINSPEQQSDWEEIEDTTHKIERR